MGPPPPADIGLSLLFTGNDTLCTTTASLLGRSASISILHFLETKNTAAKAFFWRFPFKTRAVERFAAHLFDGGFHLLFHGDFLAEVPHGRNCSTR
jgi:hypothetical protein